jgi:hypothetical protein
VIVSLSMVSQTPGFIFLRHFSIKTSNTNHLTEEFAFSWRNGRDSSPEQYNSQHNNNRLT